MNLVNKHIVVAVCGGIAAYKSAELVRALQSQGAQVRVAMTTSAAKFVTPLTFQALSGHPVLCGDNASLDPAGMDHIALARWSDAIVIAPATANIIAKITHGIADSFVSALCLAHVGNLAIAPAMNQAMWAHPATQKNITELTLRGVSIFGPNSGVQACGETGTGRMLEPQQLVDNCSALFSNDLMSNLSVLITAGPTLEPIDPVRFISNRSSGKMGYALADAALEAGANVTVISGPTHLPRNDRVKYIDIESAQQMFEQVSNLVSHCDLFISAAAVADYTPNQYSSQKIKKSDNSISLSLKHTTDIIKQIKAQHKDLFCVGFAAETENITQHAIQKLHRKSLDMIIANQVGISDQGFNSDYNAVEIISASTSMSLSRARKTELARHIIKHIASQINSKKTNTNVRYL